jgi:hypothetical protein
MLAAFLVLMPGAFVLFMGYVAVRAFRQRWEEKSQAGAPVHLWDVLTELRPKDVFREARAAVASVHFV